MRIHGLMLVKDEADIIRETIEDALPWCDAIYVFDNGSTDGTWECVQELAQRQPNVEAFRQDPRPFTQSLRGEIFRHYRHRARPGDWWCILDGDEFYIDDPREFLAGVPARFGEVWSSSFQYYFTEIDRERYARNPQAFLAEPVTQRLRYYLNNWSESRFIRHHDGLVWPSDREGRPGYRRPVGIGATYPRRIRLKHYQYRSPEQIDARLRSRMAIAGSYRHEHQADWLARLVGPAAAAAQGLHDGPPSWEDRVVPSAFLHRDDGDGAYVGDEGALPAIPRDRYGLRRIKHQARATLWRLREAVGASSGQ
ncbi:MAG: glycosyltransferase family 2 protein [Dehalococcoidia bacterium]